jgi:hypothetical protein
MFPAEGLSVPVEIVWTTPAASDRWVCGASVAQAGDDTFRAWHALVDAIA